MTWFLVSFLTPPETVPPSARRRMGVVCIGLMRIGLMRIGLMLIMLIMPIMPGAGVTIESSTQMVHVKTLHSPPSALLQTFTV
jgi:hypothetical protein